MKAFVLFLVGLFPYSTYAATAIYGGNRTFYPNGLARNESTEADPGYEAKAEGPVKVLSLPYLVPSTSLKQVQDIWGTRNNISFTYALFNATNSSVQDNAKENSDLIKFRMTPGTFDYYNTILSECQALNSQMTNSTNASIRKSGMTDLIWIDATMISYMEPCLVDIWAWDFSVGTGMDLYTLLNGVIRDRLIAVAVEVQTSFLIYNSDILNVHNYDSPPTSLMEMDAMLKSILENERALENYKLSGYTAPFIGKEDLISLLAEWAAAGNTSIVSTRGDVGLLDGNIQDVLNLFASWIDLGIIDINDVDTLDADGAFQRFKEKRSIFLRATPDLLDRARQEIKEFEWGTAVLPAYAEDLLSYLGPGTLSGWYVGVYKYAPNPFGAIKAAKYLSSLDYQRRLFVIPDMTSISSVVPIYPSVLNARSYCQSIGRDICNTYVDTQTALRPGSQSGKLYMSVSDIVDTYLRQVFRGDVSVYSGLSAMDQRIRTLLSKPARNATGGGGTDVVITKPIKKSFKNLGPQLAILIVTISIVVGGAYINKLRILRQIEAEKAKQSNVPEVTGADNTTDKSLLQMHTSVPLKSNPVIEKISIIPFQTRGDYNRLHDVAGDDEIIELEETKAKV